MRLYLNLLEYIDTNEPLDISLELSASPENVRAWYVDPPIIEPVKGDGFVGAVAQGGSVNFRNVFFNPHGHGTHTECLGHITKEVYSVNSALKAYFFTAVLVSVQPEERGLDKVITRDLLAEPLHGVRADALIIRTLPNELSKKHLNYSATNPAYLDIACLEVLEAVGVKHLLVDMPSVDREEDEGVLAFHHGFWQVPENPQMEKTITEMIFVSDEIRDGQYILEIQMAPFQNDAAPSRPVLYELKKG